MDNLGYLLIGSHVRRLHADSAELSVDALLRSLKAENHDIQRHQVVSAFQSFEKNGLGRFIVGRHGQLSRMSWKSLPKNLSFEIEALNAPNAVKGVVMLEYPLVMRPGVTAKLVLPADLSASESERVSAFVQRLPLGG